MNDLKERPLESTLRFRRQSFWQIVFPVALMVILLLAGIVLLFVSTGSAGTSIVADFSLMLVILLFLLIGLLALGVTIALIYGVAWLIQTLPPYTNEAQRGMKRLYFAVDRATTQAASMMIGGLAVLGGLSQAIRKLGIVPESDQPSPASEPPGQA